MRRLLLVAILLATGCAPDPETIHARYGVGMNGEREKHGLPPVPAHWEASFTGTHYNFRNPAVDVPLAFERPIHQSKSIGVDAAGRPVDETDYYYAAESQTYSDLEGQIFRQKIVIRFSYTSVAEGRPSWKAWAAVIDDGLQEVPLSQAVDIVKAWGLR